MGLYIPNMEMPKRCCDCCLCYDCYVCMATETNFYNHPFEEDWTTERLPNCPLVEIPDNTYFISSKDKPLKITLDGSYEIHELNDTGDIEINAYGTLIDLIRKYGGE